MKEYRKPLSIVVSKYEREFTESGKALIKEIISKNTLHRSSKMSQSEWNTLFWYAGNR